MLNRRYPLESPNTSMSTTLASVEFAPANGVEAEASITASPTNTRLAATDMVYQKECGEWLSF